MAESEDFRRWEAERRNIKRSEIRLNHGLQSLEEARLAYLNSITKEQKRLQHELQKLQKTRSKQKPSLSTGRISINMALPLLSHQTERNNMSRDAARRTTRKCLPRPGGLSNTSQSPSQPNSNNVSSCEEDGKVHLPPLKTKDQVTVADSEVAALKNTIAKQLSISADSTEAGESHSGQGKGLTLEETRDAETKGPTVKLMNLPGKRRPSLVHEGPILDAEAYAADGRLRTMYFRPDFFKSYSAAQKFRYIRHKNIPAWEKELSLQEIFGHKTSIEHCPQTQAGMYPKP